MCLGVGTQNMPPRWFLVVALWLAGLGAAGQYAKISVVFDQLPTHYPNAGAALGFVVSLVGAVGIVFGVVAGLVVVQAGLRRALLVALGSGAVGAGLEAFMPPLPWLLALRGLEGLSHLVIVVAIPTLIAQISAPHHRAFTLTLWSTFFGVAFSLLVAFGLPLVAWKGVPALFAAHAVWMAVFAAVLALMLPRDPLREQGPALSWRVVLAQHKEIYASPALAAPGVGWLFYTFCFLALLTILPPFIPENLRAATLAAMPLASIAVSLTVGVFLLRYVSAIAVIIMGFALSILSLFWVLWVPGDPAACLALSAALGLAQGASFAAVPQLCEDDADKAKANGAMAQMGNLGNTTGTPAMLFILVSLGYAGLITTAICMFVAAILAHLWLHRRRRAVNS